MKEKLKEKLAECERQQKEMSLSLFHVDRFTMDRDISFYNSLSSYATFMAIFEYFNPGDNCDADDEGNVQVAKKGRCQKLKPLD